MSLRGRLSEYRWRERTVHPGREYPDRQFYVIRRHANRAGLFSFVSTNLGSIVEAAEKGYTPVIDMQNSPNPMLTQEEVGKVNAWDRFFLPPCGYTLEDIRHARNVMLGSIHPPANDRFPEYRMLEDPGELTFWREAAEKYLKLRPEIEAEIKAYCEKELRMHDVSPFREVAPKDAAPDNPAAAGEASGVCMAGGRVLGVLCRGTDYVQLRPHGHPVQPSVEDVIAKCCEVMREQDCRLIYLCTEDAAIWDAVNAAFPGRVKSYQRIHVSVNENENVNDVMNRLAGPYERNREYLISIGILSRCDCLVAGAAGGTYGALLLTKGYDYEYVFRLGLYE